MSWHIARFMCGFEERAARALDGLGGWSAFCPLEKHAWIAHGKKREMLRPVISGCVFVEGVSADAYRWHDVAALEGFIGFLGSDQEKPDPVRMGDQMDCDGNVTRMGVASWLARAGESWVVDFADNSVTENPLVRGDVVRLRSLDSADIDLYRTVEMARFVFGSNDNVTGVVEWVQGDGSAWVTFRGLFNQETKISISARALERVEIQSKRHRARLAVVR